MSIIYCPLRGLIVSSGQSVLKTDYVWDKFNNYTSDRESWVYMQRC